MPTLTDAQKNAIAELVNEGRSLSDIQKHITRELGIPMTYMDVRFLVDDLDLTLKSKEKAEPAETPAAEAPAATPAPAEAGTGAGAFSIVVDPVQRPGVAVGGTVTFSDGKTGKWQMDAYGQLGFEPPEPGYKPSAEDVSRFNTGLDAELRKLGY